jgi:peptide chain release factor 2
MGRPGFWDNQEKAQQTIQQLKPLNGLLKPFDDLESAVGDAQALAELSEEDAGLDAELDVELGKVEKGLDEFELRAMLSGPHDASNAYLTIQAGAGGTEACDWAQMLLRLYARWAERHGYETELIDELRNEEAGIRSATLSVKGDYAYGNLQSEAGVHRLVRISPFDANARRQTSFAAVEVLPEIEGTINIEISPDDLERETFRSGGPGGQHQNKTESGVRFRHKPTGITAESRTERSQHKNAANAMNLLKAKLYQIEEEKKRAEVEKRYGEKMDVSFGSQIRNYTLQPYTLIKDVRTGVETGQVQAVLDGEIDEFITAYLRWKAEKEHKRAAVGK